MQGDCDGLCASGTILLDSAGIGFACGVDIFNCRGYDSDVFSFCVCFILKTCQNFLSCTGEWSGLLFCVLQSSNVHRTKDTVWFLVGALD